VASEYLIGTDVDDLDRAVDLLGVEPSSAPKPGAELVPTGDAGQTWRGYARTTWLFDGIAVATYATAIVTDLGITAGDAAGFVVIYTRDEYDTWGYWNAVLRLPNPATLERWSGVYKNVALEFILLSTTAPTPPPP
jgi:hypothetical protein